MIRCFSRWFLVWLQFSHSQLICKLGNVIRERAPLSMGTQRKDDAWWERWFSCFCTVLRVREPWVRSILTLEPSLVLSIFYSSSVVLENLWNPPVVWALSLIHSCICGNTIEPSSLVLEFCCVSSSLFHSSRQFQLIVFLSLSCNHIYSELPSCWWRSSAAMKQIFRIPTPF